MLIVASNSRETIVRTELVDSHVKDDCDAAPAVEQAGGFRLKSFNLLKTKHICLVTILAILPICALLQSTQVQLIEDKNGIGGHRGKHCPGCKLREGRQLEYVQVSNKHP